jgi:hypothetical protein
MRIVSLNIGDIPFHAMKGHPPLSLLIVNKPYEPWMGRFRLWLASSLVIQRYLTPITSSSNTCSSPIGHQPAHPLHQSTPFHPTFCPLSTLHNAAEVFQPKQIHSKDGNCNFFRNVGQLWTSDAVYTQSRSFTPFRNLSSNISWTENDMEESVCGQFEGSILKCSWKDWGKAR